MIRAGAERQQRLNNKLIRYFELERMKEGKGPIGSYRCRVNGTLPSMAVQIAKRGTAGKRSAG